MRYVLLFPCHGTFGYYRLNKCRAQGHRNSTLKDSFDGTILLFQILVFLSHLSDVEIEVVDYFILIKKFPIYLIPHIKDHVSDHVQTFLLHYQYFPSRNSGQRISLQVHIKHCYQTFFFNSNWTHVTINLTFSMACPLFHILQHKQNTPTFSSLNLFIL